VDDIAASLTDFQSSISNELEAELLTGKDLNLEKARELALNNDLEGVSKELFKNSSDIAEFGKMNRIQQESYAKALGMTKDQLAKMAYNKALEAGMTEKQASAAAGVNAEEMKRVAMQENFAKALEKISGALAPILDIVGDVLSVPFVPYLLMGGFAVMKIGGGLLDSAKSMGSLAKGTLDFVKNLNMKGVSDFFGGLKDKFGALKEAFGEGLADKVQEKVADTGGSITEKLGDKASEKAEELAGGKVDSLAEKVVGGGEEVSKPAKGGVKKGLQDLAAGLKSMGGKGVIQGIGNLALAGPAMLVAVASIPFLLTIAAVGVPAGVGLKGLASGLKALGAAGAGALEGIGILALFGVALIPFTYALSLLSPLIESFGKAIKSTFEGIGTLIQSAADGFVTLMGAMTMEKILPMLLLGPALFGIAAGLAAIAIAGPMAIPALIAVTGLAAVVGGVATIFGAGESKSAGEAKGKGEEGSLAAVEKKLDDLISAVRAGGNVYMDSNKVGRAQVLGSYKSA
jgi:hypothetical protein